MLDYIAMKKTYLSFLFILFCSTACAESIVLEPQEPLDIQRVVLPTPEPIEVLPPETKWEYTQYYATKGIDKAQQNKGLIWPILMLFFVLLAFFKMLKLIYELTTSSPSF